MSRPSHWLSLWFLALGLGMWSLGVFERVLPMTQSPAAMVLQHSGRQALEPVVASLAGRVVDRLGWPIADAVVEGPDGKETRSDAQGRFSLEVEGLGQHLLVARATSHGTATIRGMSGDPLLLVLGPALPWQTNVSQEQDAAVEIMLAGEGTLVDADGDEIPGGRVLVLETGDTVQADEYGRFRLPLPASASHLLAYDAAGRVGEMAFSPSRSQGVLPLGQIELQKGLELVGVLRTSENDVCAEATLQLSFAGMQRHVITDAAGRFAFRGLVPGGYVLTALPHRGDLGFRESISLHSNHDADWILQPARSLRIQVIGDQQDPQAGAHVVAEDLALRSAYARADAEGWAILTGLGEGPYDFAVRDPDLSELHVLSYDADRNQLLVGDVAISTKER